MVRQLDALAGHGAGAVPHHPHVPRRSVSNSLRQHGAHAARGRLSVRQQGRLRRADPRDPRPPSRLRVAAARRRHRVRLPEESRAQLREAGHRGPRGRGGNARRRGAGEWPAAGGALCPAGGPARRVRSGVQLAAGLSARRPGGGTRLPPDAGHVGSPRRPGREILRVGRQPRQLSGFPVLGLRGRGRGQGTAARRVFQLRPGGARCASLADRYSLAPARVDYPVRNRRLEPGVPCGGVVRAWRGDSAMQLNTAKRASFDEGSLDQYLREISQYPLITREEEVTLAQRIKQSDAEALDKLVRSNLRFVVSVAKKYQNQGVSLSDLINEGNLGLIRAAHKFDETKGIKFISYAVWWIRQAILQALAEQSRIVRVPLNRAGTLHRIGKRANALLQELGRDATHAEIAQGMDITEEEVAKTMAISQTHLSLDAPMTPGEDNRLLDYLPDTLNPTPDEQTFEKALTESIEEALSHLKERESKILRLYFGLDRSEPMTLEQIGALPGITRERVRPTKEKRLTRLRHVSRARALESYLG